MVCADRTKSWLWTSAATSSLVVVMDDDTLNLISQICTQVGMIMEDAVVGALTIGRDPDRMRAALDELTSRADRIRTLIGAARALLD